MRETYKTYSEDKSTVMNHDNITEHIGLDYKRSLRFIIKPPKHNQQVN